jgi:pimeloyl-ACP methyl ester carboxylesterase
MAAGDTRCSLARKKVRSLKLRMRGIRSNPNKVARVNTGADWPWVSACLCAIDVPIFIAHGGDDDDEIVPIGASALKSAELIKDATLKVYPGAPHGLTGAYGKEVNVDLLAFLKG